ncbi:MAG: hypothetical protein Fur0016_22040 [Anaerolineales bacterium]
MKRVKTKQPTKTAWPWQLVAVIVALVLLAVGLAFRSSIAARLSLSPTPVAPAASKLPEGAIEQAGFVTVRQMTDVKTVYLFAEPKPGAQKMAELPPGKQGELLGQDASGEWLYVRFDDKTGWMPIYFLFVTAVE